MLVRIKPAGTTIPATEMLENIYVTLLSEQILEIKDRGLKVYDQVH